VLIATPGRLLDHLQSTPRMLSQLSFLVLDEADRLLDEGFQRDMEKIFALLPTARQTILASATLPNNMAQFKHLCLRPGYVTVSAIVEGGEQMNAQLQESVQVVSLDTWLPALYALLEETVAKKQKTILFLQAAQETRLLAFVLAFSRLYPGEEQPGLFEIHSRLSQPQRMRQLDGFRAAAAGSLLCSSDVGARGWDIDDVDCVIQVGIPTDNDTYVHRVGRTARAGSSGFAKLLAFDWEAPFFFNRYPRAKASTQGGLM
jgi:ATP-dependent RNA helicase MSS116